MQVLPVLRVTKKVSEIRPGSGVRLGLGVGGVGCVVVWYATVSGDGDGSAGVGDSF